MSDTNLGTRRLVKSIPIKIPDRLPDEISINFRSPSADCNVTIIPGKSPQYHIPGSSLTNETISSSLRHQLKDVNESDEKSSTLSLSNIDCLDIDLGKTLEDESRETLLDIDIVSMSDINLQAQRPLSCEPKSSAKEGYDVEPPMRFLRPKSGSSSNDGHYRRRVFSSSNDNSSLTIYEGIGTKSSSRAQTTTPSEFSPSPWMSSLFKIDDDCDDQSKTAAPPKTQTTQKATTSTNELEPILTKSYDIDSKSIIINRSRSIKGKIIARTNEESSSCQTNRGDTIQPANNSEADGSTIKSRIVDHIRKNYLLFNTNRKTFLLPRTTFSNDSNTTTTTVDTKEFKDGNNKNLAKTTAKKRKRVQILSKESNKSKKSSRESTNTSNNSSGESSYKGLEFIRKGKKNLIASSRSSLRLLRKPFVPKESLFITTKSVFLLPPKEHQPVDIISKNLSEFEQYNLDHETNKQNIVSLSNLIKTSSLKNFVNKNKTSFDSPSVLLESIQGLIKMPSGNTDKALIVDNKDGTIKFSYDPKEVGHHELSVRYNDEPLQDGPITFYVDTVGTAKKKITAYGPGLNKGIAGDPCKFTINTGGLGSAKLNVSVEGPSKCQVNCTDNKDGTITVNYLPLVPGDYKIKVTFDGKQIVGSPFNTRIGGEGRKRAQISLGQGSQHSLDLKVSEGDLKILNAVIVTPCGLEEPCSLKKLPNGQLAISFTPREQGSHSINVKRLGNHIGGSPFRFDVLSRDIGDAKQVKVSGKGLKEGKTNTDNEIIINTKEAGYGGLSLSIEGPSKADLSTKESTDGTIKVIYKPYEPGYYNINVKYADHVVPGSPFTTNVTGQGTNPKTETIKRYRKLEPILDANSDCRFTFKMPGKSAYDLSARILSPHGATEDASITDMSDYVYQVRFVPKEVGVYTLSIRDKDIHIPGSPFPYTIGPMTEFGAHKVRCGGAGLIRGTCGKLNEFNVYTREAGAGELAIAVEGPSAAKLVFNDRKDGSCHVGYQVESAGEYRISLTFDGREIPDSPFKAFVMPQTGEVSKIELGPLPPENMIQLNKPCNIPVIMNGARGNIEGKVILPSGKMDDCFASPIDAENWGVRFIPRELGVHQVQIKYNKGTVHIPQSPVLIRVGHDQADPAAVMVHGHGLRDASVNHATDFTIETCNAGHGSLEVTIQGPSKVSMDCTEIDEGYKVHYTPLAPGYYYATIKYNGAHVTGSPFKIRAIKPPGSKQVADLGNDETSTIILSTTDKEAKQKAEHMPKFKSDASKVYCKGMGLKKAFANKPNSLTVNCSEAGFNLLYAAFLGPSRNTIHDVSVKHMGGSIYQVNYTCKDKGDAILVINYGDEQIPGSPFRVDVV